MKITSNSENTGNNEYFTFRTNFEYGAVVMIEMYSIDEDIYIYYAVMNDEGGGLGGASTPYTPKSNFGSEVLGYFAAWSKVDYITTVQ